MATITLEPARTIEIDPFSLTLERVTDNQVDTITASIKGLWREIILWQGADEYASAGLWTNETAKDRAAELITSNNIRFV